MIRQARSEDINQIVALGNQLHSNFSSTYDVEKDLKSPISIINVYEENETIYGYVYATNIQNEIDLLSIYIDKDKRHQKIGQKLLNTLKNTKVASITLEVSSKNVVAQKFYENNEFKKVGMRKNYYKDSDAIIMRWENK